MDESSAMLRVLAAEGPASGLEERAALFDRLVGSWDLEMTARPEEAPPLTFTGEWHFGWVLEGRTVQDVLITRSPDGTVVGYGSTVRSLDPNEDRWWVVWQDPVAGEFAVLLARAEGDRIVMEGQWNIGDNGRDFRWTFSEMTETSFLWRNEVSSDGGETWRTAEEFRARRRDGV
jgi:hypothetical protein